MQIKRWVGYAVVGVSAVLSACGGGSSSNTAAVSGYAATGAAITTGAVTLKCASGNSYSTVTGVDGRFSLNVAGAALPCVAEVAYTDAAGNPQKLHSFVAAAGIANITPFTELLLASLTGGTAANAFDNLDAATVRAYTAANITTAIAAVKTYLQGLGIDVTNFPTDPIGAAFVPVPGDVVDAILDALAAQLLANGTTLDQAVTAVAASSGNSGGGGGSSSGSSSGTLTVSAGSVSTRNGSYVITGAGFTSGSNSGFNGNTADGKFEMQAEWSSNSTILRAHVWYFDANSAVTYFGCDGSVGIPCTGVAYDPAGKEIRFTNTAWQQIQSSTIDLTGATPDVLEPSGETLTVNGTITVP